MLAVPDTDAAELIPRAEFERVVRALAEREAELARIDQLEALFARLTERLGEDSSNSSKPPSSDPPATKLRNRSTKIACGKKKSKLKRGGQPGHKGSHRLLVPVLDVDEVIELFPSACECGAKLPRTVDPDPRRFQQTELGMPVRVFTTEWRRHRVTCPSCGHKTRAGVASVPKSAFGVRLTSTVALLTGVYHLSRRKTVRLMHEVFGVRISLGTVSACESRAADALGPAFEQALEHVRNAPIKHADGTSWAQAGLTLALWTLATPAATVFKILQDNTAKTLRILFGKLRGLLVSDRATALGFWAMNKRQICWAHLLRKFVSFSERDGPAGRFGHELLDYAGIVFAYWTDLQDDKMNRREFRALMTPVREQFDAALQRAVNADIGGLSGSCEDIHN